MNTTDQAGLESLDENFSLAPSPVDGCQLHAASSNTLITAYSSLPKSCFIAPLQLPFEAGSVMEFVGCAASVSQLVVYISSSAASLQRLYVELRSGDSTYRSEANNIDLLLNIFQRLSRRTIEDCNPVLPILIAISGIACEVLCLLKPRRVFGINWTPITAQDRINSAFESLDKKRRILHLYISQAHHEALVDLREAIDRSNMANPGKNSAEKVTEKVEPDETPEPSVPPSAESVPPAITEQSAAGQTLQPQAEENSKQGTFNMKMNEAKIEGFQGWLNRDNMPDKVNLEANGLTVGPDGFSANGNASNWSAGVTRSQQANPEGNTSKNTRSSS